jgi:hypothetical protein
MRASNQPRHVFSPLVSRNATFQGGHYGTPPLTLVDKRYIPYCAQRLSGLSS